MNGELPAGEARRLAIQQAEILAKDQIKQQAAEMKIDDQRRLGDVAVSDPFVGALLDDTVRTGRITDRTISSDGTVSVTVKMDLAPLEKLIADYQQRAMNQRVANYVSQPVSQ